MLTTIRTGGCDIHIADRPNGGYTITQGRSYVLVTPAEAAELATALQTLIAE
jgi:hypothetical protein